LAAISIRVVLAVEIICLMALVVSGNSTLKVIDLDASPA
jgi:hypothetical protein